jgi:hypothetical protein
MDPQRHGALRDVLGDLGARVRSYEGRFSLHGSLSLHLHGIALPREPQDVDIAVDTLALEGLASSYQVTPTYLPDLETSVLHIPRGLWHVEAIGPNVIGEKLLEWAEPLPWEGLVLPVVPPLKLRELYMLLGRDERTNLIDSHYGL